MESILISLIVYSLCVAVVVMMMAGLMDCICSLELDSNQRDKYIFEML